MTYREAGGFETGYAAEAQVFPIRFDAYLALLAVAFLGVPLVIDAYRSNAILIPFLVWAIAAIGQRIRVGARSCGAAPVHMSPTDLSVDKSVRACPPGAGALPRQPGRREPIGELRACWAPLALRHGLRATDRVGAPLAPRLIRSGDEAAGVSLSREAGPE